MHCFNTEKNAKIWQKHQKCATIHYYYYYYYYVELVPARATTVLHPVK